MQRLLIFVALLVVLEPIVCFKASKACPSPTEATHGVSCLCAPGVNGVWQCGSYPDVPNGTNEALIVTSQEGVAYMEPKVVATTQKGRTPATDKPQMGITLDVDTKLQRILGFGGAFTDATAYHYSRFNGAAKKGFISQYWGVGGIGYKVGRVPMNAADFSRMNYALHNVSGDIELKEFCLRDDSATEVQCGQDYKADLIVEAQAVSNLSLFISTWSAPTWLKSQHFGCSVRDGVNVCSQSSSKTPVTMNCTSHISNPNNCLSNKQGEPCPSTPIDIKRTHPSGEVNVPSPTPDTPIENAKGNCYNTGFLSETRQA